MRGRESIYGPMIKRFVRQHPNTTRREIRSAIGCSNGTVTNYVKRFKLKLKRSPKRSPKREMVEKLLRKQPHLSYKEVMERTGCCLSCVTRARRALKIINNKPSMLDNPKYVKDIRNLDISLETIATKWNMNYGTVATHSRKLGIKRNTRHRYHNPIITMKVKKKKEVVMFLRERGFTWREIGNLFNVTRQRAQQIVGR